VRSTGKETKRNHDDVTFGDVGQGREQAIRVLPYEEFVSLKERLEDMEDLLQLRKAKKAEGRKRTVPLAHATRRLDFG